jgi:aconitate hydratase
MPSLNLPPHSSVDAKHFNTYGARRGHDEVMARGTFANIRLVNKMASRVGPYTMHVPSGQEMDIFSAAQLYKRDGQPVKIIEGKFIG